VLVGKVLALEEGEVEITYSTGTKLLLVGPAEFVVESAGGKLRRGGLVASVTEAGHGFTIETPNGKVVDLGTEFGVAGDDFGLSEVSVFQGKVEAYPGGKQQAGKKFELTKGHGLQWNEGDLISLDADLRRFATSVLDLSEAGISTGERKPLVDRFREASLNAKAWNALGNVKTSVDGLLLAGNDDPSNRPYLVSKQQYDPSLGPVAVAVDFVLTEETSADFACLAILTRSANERGIALHDWQGSLARNARCSYGTDAGNEDSSNKRGALRAGIKMESDRELKEISGSEFLVPEVGTPYRAVMRDDGVNVSFTVSLREKPKVSKTITFRSLFHGNSNFIAVEGPRQGCALIERVEVSQDLSATSPVSYAEISALLFDVTKEAAQERKLLAKLSPAGSTLLLQESFDTAELDTLYWNTLGEVLIRDGAVQLGLPNAEGHIDTWKGRPYLLTRQPLDPREGTLTIVGRMSFAENFLNGYGASFAVTTRADERRGNGPGWENSVLRRGIRANFWPAAWNSKHSIEIHEKPAANTITLLATQGLQVNPLTKSYLFQVIDDGSSVMLTIIDPKQPEKIMTISSPTTSEIHQGFVGFESCWGSPITLDDIRIYQTAKPQ